MFSLKKNRVQLRIKKRAYLILSDWKSEKGHRATVCESQRGLLTQIDRDIMNSVRGMTTDLVVIVINDRPVKIENANDVLC